jgi:hypothetical protein
MTVQRCWTLVTLLGATSAWAAPVVDMAGTCPGPVTFTISGLTPGAPYYLARARDAGVATIPAGPCAGTEIRLDPTSPGWNVQTLTAPPSGTAVFNLPSMPLSLCDRRFEAVDTATCEVSALTDAKYPICNGPFQVALTQADATALSVCQSMTSVYVDAAVLSWPSLVHIGEIVGVAPTVTQVSMPALRRAHVGLLLDFPGLLSVNVANLGRAPAFQVQSPVMTSLNAASLSWASLVSVSAPTLGPINLPALQHTETLDLNGTGAFVVPALQTADTVFLAGPFTAVDLGSLTHVNYMPVRSSALTQLNLGSLQTIGDGLSTGTDYVDVYDNPLLSAWDVSSLQAVDSFRAFNNPMLCPADGGALNPVWSTVTSVTSLLVYDNMPGCFTWP